MIQADCTLEYINSYKKRYVKNNIHISSIFLVTILFLKHYKNRSNMFNNKRYHTSYLLSLKDHCLNILILYSINIFMSKKLQTKVLFNA
jgi:hypothetical protein